jgi:ABC-type nitrate/sulfonate/bicarbonate transport system substrate-binding protein
MAVEKGFFAEQYLVVDYVNATTPVQSKALVGGQLDFYTGGVSEVILANEAGQDIVLIASLSNAMALSLYATSDFPTVQDLVGQSIGVGSVATTSYIAAQIILDYYGLTGQVSLTPITGGGPVILAALEGGQVVAAQFAPPSTAMADAQGFVEIVHGPDLDLDWVQGGVAVTRSFATENPAAVERVAAALVKTWQFVGDPANRDSVIELISRCTGATIEDSEVTYDYVHPIWQVDEKPLVSLSGMETAIKYTEGAGSQQAADQFDNSYLENS